MRKNSLWKSILIILFIIFIISVLVKMIRYKQEILYYDYGNPNSKIKICFIAGVHGNEPAGSILLNELVSKGYFNNTNIFIRVIPVANKFGIIHDTRFQNKFVKADINRNFEDGEATDNTSKKLVDLTKDMDLIIDFHEGWGFHKLNKGSIGSTVTSGNFYELANKITENVNKNIEKIDYKFVFRKKPCNIESSFGCYNYRKNKKYILIETSGQNDIQPINVRTGQVRSVINTVLDHYLKNS